MPKQSIIVIGASAGGVEALTGLLKHLPGNLNASLFVVMHIGTESRLPEILDNCGNLPVIPAEHKKPYRRGCVYVAPVNHHLLIKDSMTILSRGPRENGHRPAVDVLFRSAARMHRSKVIGILLSGGRDDGSAGLFIIKARGGVAIVQDPAEAITPNMPRNALKMVDIDYCLPVRQIASTVMELVNRKLGHTSGSANEGSPIEDRADVKHPASLPPGKQIPVSCPECDGPLFEVKEGDLARFQCFVGHAFSPESLSDEHTEALERALWTTTRKLKERIVLYRRMIKHKKRNQGEAELMSRLKESVMIAEKDLKLLREIFDRI